MLRPTPHPPPQPGAKQEGLFRLGANKKDVLALYSKVQAGKALDYVAIGAKWVLYERSGGGRVTMVPERNSDIVVVAVHQRTPFSFSGSRARVPCNELVST